MKTVAIIPARYGSTRFPAKPLALIAGKPMIQWTYESTCKCPDFAEVLVATDDERIQQAVQNFGGKAVMTSESCRSGTDRIWEAIQGREADLVVNVQGDEPLIPAKVLHQLVVRMKESGADMGTVAVPFGISGRDPMDPNAVKVVLDANNFALYFSRAPIPFQRQGGESCEPLLHWGLYAYTRAFLADRTARGMRKTRTASGAGKWREDLRADQHGTYRRCRCAGRCRTGRGTFEEIDNQ